MQTYTNTITTSTSTTAGPQLLAVSVRDAMDLTGLGRSTLYRLIDAGQLVRIKVRGRALIPYDSLRALVTAG